MSAGPFLRGFYETEVGNIAPIRLQPETAALSLDGSTNAIPAGPSTAGFPSAQVSRGRRSIGVNARLVRVQFAPGAAPTGYKEGVAIALPWFQADSFANLPTGATGTYLGSSVTLVGKTAESVR